MTALTTATLALVRAGTEVPGYDRTAVTPGILHIGVGGFHRSHQAAYLDEYAVKPAEVIGNPPGD